MRLGRIEKVKLREIWKNEARDFTPWLAEPENLAYLGQEIGLALTDAETEVSVGGYSCDIKCKLENDDRIVVIENQIEESNHDHLGKSIVYASGLSASIIIWVVRNARPEHASAIEWLNEHTDGDVAIFLIEIKAIKIDDSKPAPRFEIIQQPNNYVKTIKSNKGKEFTDGQLRRYDFWAQLSSYINDSDYKISPQKNPWYDHWFSFSLGTSKCHIEVNLLGREKKIRVMLNITTGPDNKALFDELYAKKEKIEEILGVKSEWDRKDDKGVSWISTYINNFSFEDVDKYTQFNDEICKRVLRFAEVYKKLIK